MPKFQLHDTVVLRHDPSFVGLVERTSHVEAEPLDECLIIAHTHVPAKALELFVTSGTPPAGYIFVPFASQTKGSSLVAEDDLHLINRMFELGDVVKLDETQQTGTVINVSSSYVLDPVWQPALSSDGFNAVPIERPHNLVPTACSSTCQPLDPRVHHPFPPRLIPNVPFEELKRAQDFMEGDYIIEQDWLGVVDDVELVVIIKLSNNSVVAVSDPEELFIPIPDYGKPLVSLPEFDGIPRPHYVSATQGWGNMIPPEDLECGQFVVANHKNLRNGRWLRGSYDPEVKPEGHVLMVRCRRLGVHWIICNAYTPEKHWRVRKPDSSIPYENLNTFPHPTEIRRNRNVALYDPSKHVTKLEDRTWAASPDAPAQKSSSLSLSSHFSVGDQVKFRDAAGAAVKYQGRVAHGVEHGKFNRIFHTDTLLYDLNEFEIVQSSQTSTVRWQDGSVSEHPSTALTKIVLFEADLMPADIVVAREGMKQRPYDDTEFDVPRPSVDFNEMTYFEKPHDLLPEKVGIVQKVSQSDKVAQIRWFARPRIRITANGQSLGCESRFGPVSDELEDVSLYEVMNFPGLIRKVRDIVILPPAAPSAYAVKLIENINRDDFVEVGATITTLSQIEDRSPGALLEWMQHLAFAYGRPKASTSEDQYKAHRSIDWVGEICEIRTDGLVVVRLNNTNDSAFDALVEHDQILTFVDDHPSWLFDYSEDPMAIDDGSGSDDSTASDHLADILSETVEYEGGQRLDNDTGDENWESEDESQEQHGPSRKKSVVMTDVPIVQPSSSDESQLQADALQNDSRQALVTTVPEITSKSLASFWAKSEPSAFLCLERDPPDDQFGASEAPQTSPAFLKRIAKEHRILSTSLPQHEIYVRTYESRLDLLRCLIIGPMDTPYEQAPFVIDLHLGRNFPYDPPTAHFHSWTSGMGRINPNMYEEGKICLSLLGTWPGKSETEGWSEKATILQLLVSLQGLVFVKQPFYNEAGFEGYEISREYTNESFLYSEKAYIMGRNFVKHALSRPVAGLEDVLAWTYLPKSKHDGQLANLHADESGTLRCVINRSQALIRRSEELYAPSQQLGGEADEDRLLSGDGKSDDDTTAFLRPLSKGALVMLNKTLKALENIWAREVGMMMASP